MTTRIDSCVICRVPLQEKVIGIVVDTHPAFDRKRDSMLGGFITIEEPEFLVSTVCNNVTCLKSLLEQLVSNPSEFLGSFEKTNATPGSWFGPSGCHHYLKGLYQTERDVLGWHAYANNLNEDQLSEADRSIRARLSHIFEQTDAKPVKVSLVGGYGHLFDGWVHFCDANCALTSLFGKKDEDPLFFAHEISYNGLPTLAVV